MFARRSLRRGEVNNVIEDAEQIWVHTRVHMGSSEPAIKGFES